MKLIECTQDIFGSYIFLDVIATRKEIEQKIGSFENHYSEDDADGKVYFEWSIQTEDGSLKFRIYDWKEGYPVSENETIFWHIGADSNSDIDNIKKCLEENGLNVIKRV